LHSTKKTDGKKKKGWKLLSSKKNLIQDSVGNEKNGCPVPHLNKKMKNVTKEPSDTNIKTLKEEFGKISLRNSWRDTGHG
jgi:hypothetical protein